MISPRFKAAAFVLALFPAVYASAADRAVSDRDLSKAQRLLKSAILIDGHNDLPWAIRTDEHAPGDVAAYDLHKDTAGDTDISRLRAGGVGAQFWSVYTPGESQDGFIKTQLEQIDIARRMIDRYPETFSLALTAADIRKAKKQKKIASLIGIEGGHAIENSLSVLRSYFDLGVRYMTLTHNTHTDWADSAAELPARHGGLNALGEEIVAEMNRLGMLVDLSHTSTATTADALRVSQAPVIFSHSAVQAICNVPRNVPDDLLRQLKRNGGVLMVTFVAGFVDPAVAAVMQPAIDRYNREVTTAKNDAEREAIMHAIFDSLEMPVTSVAKVADHIDHIRAVAGVEHVGIGGDFDGNSAWPEGLSDVSMYPNLFAELIGRGWNKRDLKLLAGGNVLRAMEQAEAVAARMQAAQR